VRQWRKFTAGVFFGVNVALFLMSNIPPSAEIWKNPSPLADTTSDFPNFAEIRRIGGMSCCDFLGVVKNANKCQQATCAIGANQ